MTHLISTWNYWLANRRSPRISLVAVLLLAGLAVLDFLLAPEVSLSLFYVLPIALLTLRHSTGAGLAGSLVAATAMTLSGPAIAAEMWSAVVFNYFVRIGGMSLIVGLMGVIRRLFQQNQRFAHEREAMLTAELATKRQIIDEIHHRIKNQLGALQLYLYSKREDGNATQALEEAISRVGVMNLLYDHLTYQSPDQQGIALRQFVERLVALIAQAEGLPAGRLLLDTDGTVDQVRMQPTQSHAVGLILHELITNSIKHVVQKRPDGLVRVHLRTIPEGVCLSVQDNGPGYDFDAAGRPSATGGMGMAIAKGVARQLGSPLLYSRTAGSLLRFCLPLPATVLPQAGQILPDPAPPRLPQVAMAV